MSDEWIAKCLANLENELVPENLNDLGLRNVVRMLQDCFEYSTLSKTNTLKTVLAFCGKKSMEKYHSMPLCHKFVLDSVNLGYNAYDIEAIKFKTPQ